ncbi:UNVERIFIED_CONTAM: hypothetical protein HDU68_005134 [Siphonaria sp. JEL0065]|nr:hypothetical protein HDU68_005134 [Siphonaria sp. JEL0065]
MDENKHSALNASASMAERLMLWRKQRDANALSNANTNTTTAAAATNTAAVKTSSVSVSVKSTALTNKTRVNNSNSTAITSSAASTHANAIATIKKRSLSQSQSHASQDQSQQPQHSNNNSIHQQQQAQKKTKVVFDLPPPVPHSVANTQQQQQPLTQLPQNASFTFTAPTSTTSTIQKQAQLLQSHSTTAPATAPPPATTSSLSQLLKQAQEKSLSLQSQLSSTQSQLSSTQSHLSTTQSQLAQSQESHAKLKELHDSAQRLFTQDLDALNCLVNAKETQIKNLLDSVGCWETQVGVVGARNDALETECKTLQATLGQVKEVVEHQRHRISELTLRLAESEQKQQQQLLQMQSQQQQQQQQHVVELQERVDSAVMQRVSKVKEGVFVSLRNLVGLVNEFGVALENASVVASAIGEQELVEDVDAHMSYSPMRSGVEAASASNSVVETLNVSVQTATVETFEVATQCNLEDDISMASATNTDEVTTFTAPSAYLSLYNTNQQQQQQQQVYTVSSMDTKNAFMDVEAEIEALVSTATTHNQNLQSQVSQLTNSYSILQSVHAELQETFEMTSETYTTNNLLFQAQLVSITTRVSQLLSTLPLPSSPRKLIEDDNQSQIILDLESKLSATTSSLQTSLETIAKLTQDLTDSTSERRDLQAQMETIHTELRDCYQVIDYYEKSSSSSSLSDDDALDTAATSSTIVSSLEISEELEDLRLEINAKKVAIESLQAEIEKERDTCRAQGIEIGMLRQEVSEAYEVIDLFEKDGGSGGVGGGKKQKKKSSSSSSRMSISDDDEEEGKEELERELKNAKERIQVLYQQVETLGSKNAALVDVLQKRESRLKSVEGSLKECLQEKKMLLAKRDEISGPRQTDLSCLTIQQAENAIANMKLLKLNYAVTAAEVQNEKDAYIRKIAKLTKELEETAGLEQKLQKVQEDAVGGIQKLLAQNKAKDEELQLLKKQLEQFV